MMYTKIAAFIALCACLNVEGAKNVDKKLQKIIEKRKPESVRVDDDGERCTVTLYDCASKIGTWVGECSKSCVLSTLNSVGLCVVAPLVCGASAVTCCQNKRVKDKMWWWCDQASRNNFCSFWGVICGSCAAPRGKGGEPECCEYCMTDCMVRTGKRLEERKEYLKEQNRKVERRDSVTSSSESPSIESVGDMKEPELSKFKPLEALRPRVASPEDVRALQANADRIDDAAGTAEVGFSCMECLADCFN